MLMNKSKMNEKLKTMRQHSNTILQVKVNFQCPIENNENTSLNIVTYYKAVYLASFKEMKQTIYIILFIKILHMAIDVQRSTRAFPAEAARLLTW